MSLAKSAVTGVVYRTPEKRFTQNNVGVSAFVMNIGDKEEMLIRVISKRNIYDDLVSSLNKGDKVLVEGRLQTATAKMDDGTEKKIFEIDANTVERWGEITSSDTYASNSSEDIVKFESDDLTNELINEDEIPF